MPRSDERATLAIGEPLAPRDPRTVIVGIPDTAWQALPQGGTMTFDLSHAGLHAQLVIFRAENGAAVAELLNQSQALLDNSPDVGIKDPTKQ